MHKDQRGLLIEPGDVVAGHYYGGYASVVLFTVIAFTKKRVKLHRLTDSRVKHGTTWSQYKYAEGKDLAVVEKGWRNIEDASPGRGELCFVRFTMKDATAPSVAPAEYNDGEFCILSPADCSSWEDGTFSGAGMTVQAWKPMIFPEP